jgi:mRNA interferase YafQ
MLHIRVDDDIKEQATLALTAMGLSVSDAVRLFLHRVVVEQAFPLELKVPNAETLAAMQASRAMMSARRVRFTSADERLADLEKTAASQRAAPPRAADYTKAFLKDWQRLSHSGRFDLVRLKEAMMLLIANNAPLGPEWLDHPLKGDWADHRECHIGGDFLLIYQIEGNTVNFVRSGTHSELFSG